MAEMPKPEMSEEAQRLHTAMVMAENAGLEVQGFIIRRKDDGSGLEVAPDQWYEQMAEYIGRLAAECPMFGHQQIVRVLKNIERYACHANGVRFEVFPDVKPVRTPAEAEALIAEVDERIEESNRKLGLPRGSRRHDHPWRADRV